MTSYIFNILFGNLYIVIEAGAVGVGVLHVEVGKGQVHTVAGRGKYGPSAVAIVRVCI